MLVFILKIFIKLYSFIYKLKKCFCIRLSGQVFVVRKFRIEDFLYTGIIPELYKIKESKKDDAVSELIAEFEDPEVEAEYDALRDLINRVILEYKGKKTLQEIFQDNKMLQELYANILNISLKHPYIYEVDESILRDLYFAYKHQNYADIIFGKKKLDKMAELAFNRLVFSVGFSAEQQQMLQQQGVGE